MYWQMDVLLPPDGLPVGPWAPWWPAFVGVLPALPFPVAGLVPLVVAVTALVALWIVMRHEERRRAARIEAEDRERERSMPLPSWVMVELFDEVESDLVA